MGFIRKLRKQGVWLDREQAEQLLLLSERGLRRTLYPTSAEAKVVQKLADRVQEMRR